jgi:hypothetical protein
LTQNPSSYRIQFATDKDLSNQDLTYFLMVDVKTTASGSSPDVTPSIKDDGYLVPLTNNNILPTFGSSVANVQGRKYNFSSIFPPTLVSSFPAVGQLDVDPTQPSIDLVFSVPVWTLDQKIVLYRQGRTAPVAVLQAANGFLPVPPTAPTANLASPLRFDIPPGTLKPDSVYYILIAPGRIDSNPGLSTGIRDQSGNLFAGISFSGTLYFKTAATTRPPKILSPPGGQPDAPAPNVTALSLGSGSIQATFDQTGKAYYIVLSNNATPPSVAQIKGLVAYSGSIKQGEFDINQTNTVAQGTSFSAALAPNTTYDVWLSAESYARKSVLGVVTTTAISTTNPFRGVSNNFAEGPAVPGSPTLGFTTLGSYPTTVTCNTPVMNVCKNSFQILNSPIIINEGSVGNFSGGAQQFFLVLPSGYQFDVSTTGSNPSYGSIMLSGSDFAPGSGKLSFLSSSVVSVEYVNNGSASLDNVTISGLRVLVSINGGGSIVRIGGTGGITQISQFATLNSFDAPKIGFDNSYSISIGKPATIATPGNPSTAAVTIIPDNFNSPNLRVELIPLPVAGDFGPNSFSGAGVNINQLSLGAVNLGIPFNITITHTDNNGCISENSVPYTVYDRNTAIGGLATKYCFTNINYPQPVSGSLAYIPATGTTKYDIVYTNLPAFYMRSLVTTLPSNIPISTPFGRDVLKWKPIIENNLLVRGTEYRIDNPITGGRYYDYSFDEAKILNAPNFTSDPSINSPYDYFRAPLSPQGNTYFTGGSLGPIEFEGEYQSIANAALQIPLRQTVEVYLPAIPIIETGFANRSKLDPITNGDTNPITVAKGTPIYCQAGGTISLNGFPAAAAGTSSGKFTLENVSDGLIIFANKFSVPTSNAGTNASGNTQIVLTQPARLLVGEQVEVFGSNVSGLRTIIAKIDDKTYILSLPFVTGNVVSSVSVTIALPGVLDNQNGIGSIDPLIANNGFQLIRIRYTYKENASPCQSPVTQTIRITPNPVAAFNQGVLCEDTDVLFTDTSTLSTATGIDFNKWDWNFGDPTSGINNTNSGINPLVNKNPTHNYADGGPKPNVTLQVETNVGCKSVVVATKQLNIGSTPAVDFSFEGVDVSQAIQFTDQTTIATGGAFSGPFTDGGTNDGFSKLEWNFGVTPLPAPTVFSPFRPVTQLAAPDNATSTTYTTAGSYTVTLKVTSQKGCESQKQQEIVVLPRVTVSPTSAYLENFESATGGSWQTINDPGSLVGSSWVKTTSLVGKTSMIIDPSINGSTSAATRTIWVTSTNGNYSNLERSALYSPSFNMASLVRPMVSFNSFVQFLPSDGLIIQYSVDNKNITDPTKKWNTIGASLGEGIDWFNTQGLGAKPGNQPDKDFGWSGTDINRWQESKHIIINEGSGKDDILGQVRVVFRFAMAALNNTPRADGFALDNFRFGERTRTILMENFANASNEQGIGGVKFEKRESDAIKLFNAASVGTEVVKVNYHTGLPGQDPFNDDNPADNSARALYYNVNFTPDSRLDGKYAGSSAKKYWSEWGQTAFDQQSLQLAQAEISIRPAPNLITANGKISGFIDVTPIVDLDDKTVLHIAVLEKSVPASEPRVRLPSPTKTGETDYEFVLKKLLPNATGTKTSTKALSSDAGKLRASQTYTFPFEWIASAESFYTTKIGVAVFLQNELTKEIYQSEIVDDLDKPTNIVTGLESILPEQVNLYPNPANDEFVIELPSTLASDARIRLIDQIGRTHNAGTLPAGKNSKTVSTAGLADGMYIVEMATDTGALIRKKVMVIH